MNIKVIRALNSYELKRKRVAAYARVSTGKASQLDSIAAQIDYFKRMITKRKSWEFAGVFADEDATGTKANRQEFQRMLQKARDGELDMIITKSISRFARNTVDLLNVVRELRSLGVAVYFERENINSLESSGELLLTVLASYAQEESRSMSLNKRWSVKKQFERGEVVGVSHLYGYDLVDGDLVINQKEAKVVRRIYRDYLSGKQSKEIADELNDVGIPRKNGGKWKPHDISMLFLNEKHCGNSILQKTYKDDSVSPKLHRNRGQKPKYLAEGTHEAIIDVETYRIVRSEVKRRTSRENSLDPPKYPFREMVFCSACGAPFNRKKSKTETFWRCARNLGLRDGTCHMQGIPERKLEEIVADVLGLEEFDPEQFIQKIERIEVFSGQKIELHLRDGSRHVATWKERSRSESWTREMRAEVGRKNRERAKICERLKSRK